MGHGSAPERNAGCIVVEQSIKLDADTPAFPGGLFLTVAAVILRHGTHSGGARPDTARVKNNGKEQCRDWPTSVCNSWCTVARCVLAQITAHNGNACTVANRLGHLAR